MGKAGPGDQHPCDVQAAIVRGQHAPTMEDPMPEPLFVSITDAAEMLGIGRTTAYGLMSGGVLHVVHHGRRAVVAVSEIREVGARLAHEAGVSAESVAAFRDSGVA